MALFTNPAASVFNPITAGGQPRTAVMGEAQVWGVEVETAINAAVASGALVFATKAAIDASLAYPANTGAWVVADGTAANNGIYSKSGASGSGSWTKRADLPVGVTGPTGATGPTGPQGATGPTGATGATGPAGTNGTNGTNGRDGVDMLSQRYRPGDAPILHAEALTAGDPQDVDSLTDGDTTTDDDGAVVRLTGPGIVAQRSLVALEPTRLYKARFVVRRRVNTGDPANDAVRVAIAWYDQNKIRLAGGSAQTVIQDINDLTVASGRRQVTETFSRSSGVGADNVAPSTARYGRAYVETFGALTAATDVEIIDTYDTTDLADWSPDVSAFDGRLVALEGLDAGDRLNALETAVGTPNILRYATKADAAAASIGASPDRIELINYAVSSDFGRSGYVRAGSEPAFGKFQSADGAWWKLSEPIFRPENYGARGDGTTNDTAAIQEMADAMWDKGEGNYAVFSGTYLSDPIDYPVNNTTTVAFGARFILNSPGVLFDFNPDANPASVEATAKSYGYWYGGKFTSFASNPTDMYAAMQVYGIRQMIIKYGVFGTQIDTNGGSVMRLTDAIRVGGLGAHKFHENRFYLVGKGIHGPNWSGGNSNSSIPLTTSSFRDNEYILGAGHQAIFMDGGWEALDIGGGFLNGSAGVAAMEFTTRSTGGSLVKLSIDNFRFEQAQASSTFLKINRTHANTVSNVKLDRVRFSGDPAGGSHIHMDIQGVRRLVLESVDTDALTATGNTALKADANCDIIQIDGGCRMTDPVIVTSACLDISASIPRRNITFPSKRFTQPQVLTGYNGDAFSTGTATLDMASLLSSFYQKHGIPPKGYHLLVQARDSGSAGTANRMIEFGRTSGEAATARNMLNLNDVPNDDRRQANIYQLAHTDGSIWLNIVASGSGTLDIWIYVQEIVW